ncbi:MAG: hypothetical protein GX817_00280, partial [Elusimicrobia bacterium]|nr:hypothetical protein [Elusimicrobiota bacterium]
MDVNPRVAALAGAYTARATDAAGVTENPAALLRLYASEVILSHSFYLVDSRISSLTAASRLG